MYKIFSALINVNLQDTFVRQCGESKWENKCTIWHVRFVYSSVAMWLKAFVELFLLSNSVSSLALKCLLFVQT